MKGNATIISVIIPTHNRSASLQRTLDALRIQTYTLQQVEVIVVADGCTDGTMEMLRHYSAPFAMRLLELLGEGPAAARNHGAAHATGLLLLFIDDDVEPTNTLVEAHVRAHQHRSDQVVIGPYPPVFQSTSFFHVEQRAWWKAVFNTMLQSGHRFTYRDLLGGNFSLEAKLFARIGGFDSTFRAHEDYELGIRLIKAGVPFTIAPEALGYHHDKSDLNRSFLRKQQEGRADVLIAHRHPELLQVLPLTYFDIFGSFLNRILRKLAFGWTTFGDALASCLRYLLDLLEWARLRHQWRRLYGVLKDYWYWRGVAGELSSWRALRKCVRGSRVSIEENDSKIELDLREGLEVAERQLDKERPVAVRIRYGQQPVGIIPPQPGAEALRGTHLRPILANILAVPLLEALALDGEITTSATIDRHKLSNSIRSLSPWFGPMEPGKMWFEQYSQWKRLKRSESEKERALREHWDRFARLVRDTAWLEEQRADWQQLAEDREQILRNLPTWIKETERDEG